MRSSRYVAQAGVIAALYAGLTLATLATFNVLAWGPIQFRVSEAVTVLACLTPAAVPGLWLGAVLANVWNVAQPFGWLDVVFGSLGSLLGAAWTWRHRDRTWVALLGPVVANALIVPAYLPVILAGSGFYEVPALGWRLEDSWFAMYLFGIVSVGVGQAVVVYGLGWPLLGAIERSGLARLLSGSGESL